MNGVADKIAYGEMTTQWQASANEGEATRGDDIKARLLAHVSAQRLAHALALAISAGKRKWVRRGRQRLRHSINGRRSTIDGAGAEQQHPAASKIIRHIEHMPRAARYDVEQLHGMGPSCRGRICGAVDDVVDGPSRSSEGSNVASDKMQPWAIPIDRPLRNRSSRITGECVDGDIHPLDTPEPID